MHRASRARGGVRIVRDHDDRFPVLAIERLEQAKNLVAGFAVEIAGRLIAQQERSIGDDRAGDTDSLLFTAGKLARKVGGAVGEADDIKRRGDVLLPIIWREGEQQWELDIASAECREQM